jgi:hypothetical protein
MPPLVSRGARPFELRHDARKDGSLFEANSSVPYADLQRNTLRRQVGVRRYCLSFQHDLALTLRRFASTAGAASFEQWQFGVQRNRRTTI